MLLANFNGKEHLRHRAVSLRQHGFLVYSKQRYRHRSTSLTPITSAMLCYDKLEVCRQSLGPLYVNDFADVTPPTMLADVCSKPGTLHSSLGVRLMLQRTAQQGKWAGIMLHCSVDCMVKSAQSRYRRRPGHVFRRSWMLAHPRAMTVLQIRLPI